MTVLQSLNADLHCHSCISDGVLKPAELAARAHANGVQIWALTDHDEVSGLDEAAQAARSLGLRFIPGVEVSVTWANKTLHIVGLNIDRDSVDVLAALQRIRSGRVERARKIAARLESLGFPASLEGALRYVSNPALVSRTHFARHLVDQGHCKTMQAVFAKYLGDGKPADVPVQWATLETAVRLITTAGGRAVIAHPGRYTYTALQEAALFDEFKQLGGSGIEVVTGSHTSVQCREYADVARRYGFMASCGSDFHSPDEGRFDLGRIPSLPGDLEPIWRDWL